MLQLKNFSFSVSYKFVKDCFQFQFNVRVIQQCLPKRREYNVQAMRDGFERVDQILTNLKIATTERNVIYSFIATILHFGNIDFDDTDSGAIVKETSKIHVSIAAKLLNSSSDELENALLFRMIEVPGSKIT